MNIARITLAAACLTACIAAPLAAEDTEKGFRTIFDGKTLEGWEGAEGLWSVEDGAITGTTGKDKPIKKNTFLIWRGGKLEDFELHLQFRLATEKGNSGIQFRSKESDGFVVGGYQADIDSPPHRYIGILYEERGRGILAERSQKVTRTAAGKRNVTGSTLNQDEFMAELKARKKNKDGWNDYVITAKGNHIVQKINGFTTVDFTDEEKAKAAKAGILAFQLHVGPPMKIQFKNIRLRTPKN